MISILLPVYNEAKYLSTLFETIITQTTPDWEVVIVDDGSTDETAQIAERWATRDTRFRLIDGGDKPGKVAAFNIAFRASRGELICHIGGDDLLPRHGLELRVNALTNAPRLAAAFGKLQFIDETGQRIGTPIPRGNAGSQSSPGATYTRELANLIFPVPESLPSEDIWLGNAARACSTEVRHIGDVVTLYRQHQENSNPRHKPFPQMSASISRRMHAYPLLLNSDLPIAKPFGDEFQQRIELEALRAGGHTFRLLTRSGTKVVDRLALASMSKPALWKLRRRLGLQATGWRGR